MTARLQSRVISVDGRITEKQVEHMADKLMQTLGFEIIRFSQPRNTMQSFGIPDRKYYHTSKGITLWYEAKRPGGKQSFYQLNFQAMVESCGEIYVVGTDDALVDWCRTNGFIR